MERRDEVCVDLATRLRTIAERCGLHATAAADGLAAGFGQVDDVIILLQPLRISAEHEETASLQSTLRRLAEKNFLTGSQAIGDGGIAEALVCGCAPGRFGFHVELTENEGASAVDAMFRERRHCVLVSTRPKAHLPLANFVERGREFTAEAIGRVTAGDVRIRWMGETLLEAETLN